MKCKKCGGKGYIESWHAGSAAWTSSVKQCCDISAYSERVQKGFTPEKFAAPQDSGVVVEPNNHNVVSLFNGA